MTRRLGMRTALAGALTAFVAATLVTAPAATAADPMYGAPALGTCFDMSVAELQEASYTEAPVDCAAKHTSQVIAVAQLPDGVAYESKAFTRFTLETCYPAQRKALGTHVRGVSLTAYSVGYFGPTAEEQAAGARWVRCDVVLVGGKKLAPLPGRLEVGRFPFKDSVARCLAGRDFRLTVCAKKHSFRATAALKVRGTRFPNDKAWKRIGEERCRSRVTSRTYRFGWPSKAAWKAGDHTLTCYSQTRR